MRELLSGESYYLKKDPMTKGIFFLFVVASILLAVYLGYLTRFSMENYAEPVVTISQLSLFLYFIIPLHACFFASEGFEYGTVKNVIAAGMNRSSYVLSKYILELKLIISWLLLFFGLYYIIYGMGAIITKAEIGHVGLSLDVRKTFFILLFNFLYLAAYAAIIHLASFLLKNTSSTTVVTFGLILGDIMLSGNLKDSSSPFFRSIAENMLIAQVMKFSGIYRSNGVNITISNAGDYLRTTLIPIVIIVICIIFSIICFQKDDIHV
jgi:ABC-2 type transport system permease protein